MQVNGNNSDRPGTIACVLTKLSQNSKLGLTFKRERKRVVIKEVKGISQRQTCLVPGLTVLSLNGMSIESAVQARLVLETAPKLSNISIVVEGQIFKAKKLKRNQEPGIVFKNVEEKQQDDDGVKTKILAVEIVSISENSMFPYISVGHHLLAINGKRVASAGECVKLLRQKKKLTLLTVPPPPLTAAQKRALEEAAAKAKDGATESVAKESPLSSNPVVVSKRFKRSGTIAGVVLKSKEGSRLGLSFKRAKKKVVFNQVRGPFKRKTKFLPGLTVLSINGVSVESAAQAKLLIETAEAKTTISVVAEGQIYKASKTSRTQKSGLSFKNVVEKLDGENRIIGVEITSVSETGMFPDIPQGHHVFAINGNRINKVADCVKLIRSKRKLSILVVPPPPLTPAQKRELEKAKAAEKVSTFDHGQDPKPVASVERINSYPPDGDESPDVSVQTTAEASTVSGDDDTASQLQSMESQLPSTEYYSEDDDGASASQYSNSNWGGTSTIASGRDWNDEQSEFIDDYDDILLGSIDSLKELAKEMGQASAHHPTRIVTSMVVGESSGDLTSQQVGITLEERLQYIFIKEVDPKGPFGQTKLMKGQCLLRINGHSVQGGISLQQAQDWLVQPCKGDDSTPNDHKHSTSNRRVLIETMQGWGTPSQEPQHILVQVQKPPAFKDAPQNVALGMSLQKHSTGICITGIAPHGLLGAKEFSSCLQVGQTILRVNDEPTPATTPELIEQLQNAHPIVSVECQDVDVDGVGITSPIASSKAIAQHVQNQVFSPVLEPERLIVEITKPDNEATIGLSLRKSVQINSILVAGISAKGLAANMGFIVGQKVLTINGRPCPSTTQETICCLRKELYLKIEVVGIDWSATLSNRKQTLKQKKMIGIRLPDPSIEDKKTNCSDADRVAPDVEIGSKAIPEGILCAFSPEEDEPQTTSTDGPSSSFNLPKQ